MSLKNRLLFSGAFGGMTANEQRLGRFIRDGEGHPAPAAKPEDVTGQDAFDAAFAEATETTPPAAAPAPAGTPPPAEPGATPPAPAPATGAGGDGGAAQPPAAAPAGDAVVPAAPAPGAPEAPPAPAVPASPAAPEAKPGLNAEDVLNRLADLVKPADKPAEAAPAPAAAPMYTPEEQAIVDEYVKNWPAESKAEELIRRAEYADIFKFVFSEVEKHTRPLFDQLRTVGNTLHTQELTAKVPDYTENLEADVTAWVDTQPSYLQEGMKRVMKSGTSDEVADLIGRYRAASGAAPAPAPAATPAPAPAPTPAPAKPVTELSSAAKQAAERLAPVSGDRSIVPAGEDTQDFDTAFAKHAAAGS